MPPTREVAWRMFAAEYNDSELEVKEAGERSPSYVITPLGAKVNRLFVVGVLTSNENVGQDGDVWRAQITDPTGVFHVYAGQYQPEAASVLSELTPPAVVAVVGKSRTYSPEEGVTYTSIRPEVIKAVDVEERDRWVLETARHTRDRLQAVNKALEMDPPSVESLRAAEVRADLAEGIVQAFEHYGKPGLDRYRAMLADALEALVPGGAELRSDFAPATDWEPREEEQDQDAEVASGEAAPAAEAATAAPPAESTEVEDKVFELTDALDDGKGAPWEEIVAAAGKDDITEEQVEEALNNLMDRGQIYEPVLGRLKRT